MCEELGKMPEYKCHKTVSAIKIDRIEAAEDVINAERPDKPTIPEGSANLYGDGLRIFVDCSYMEKHKPHVGGYYVEYEDGYKSFSPAEAFESGYTRID